MKKRLSTLRWHF